MNATHLCRSLLCAGAAGLAGCAGRQSALDPAGREAESIADLFWWMTAGGALVWVAMVGLTIWALRAGKRGNEARQAAMLIIGGGAVVPTVVLAGLLIYGLGMLPRLVARAPEGSLRVAVTGEQWWWRVRYLPGAGAAGDGITLANEIRLPVGERVEFILTSPDVIHSFWIPSLGGKVDMIPGRTNTLLLQPTRTGVFRGACAEYCGTSHAFMQLVVVVMERDAFDQWLRQQAAPVLPPRTALARAGREAFIGNGCGACHTIRGTAAGGVVGPDLTHVGGRASLAAGTLPNDPAAFRRWIGHPHAVKPEALMPGFGMLPEAQIRAIAIYLDGLQ